MTLAVVVVAGALIGLSLGALGGGGSVLTVPVLVYGLRQSAAQATTGSLVVVGITSLVGAVTSYRSGNVLLTRGLAFGAVAIGGATVGAKASGLVTGPVLLAAFAALLLVVAGVMAARQLRSRHGRQGAHLETRVGDPIITFSPSFACHCPRALKVLATATVVGLLTGFLGVGGGFLVVPALVLALGLPMSCAAGTSLVVITITSASALAVRAGTGTHPSWSLVALLTAVAVLGGWVGARLTGTDRHSQAPGSIHCPPPAGRRLYGLAGPARAHLTASNSPYRHPTLKENHYVPSSHLQEMRQDHLGRLRPARQAGDGRRPGRTAVRRPPTRPSRQQQRLASQALRTRLNHRLIALLGLRRRVVGPIGLGGRDDRLWGPHDHPGNIEL